MQVSKKSGAIDCPIDCPVLSGGDDNKGTGQPPMLNGLPVRASEKAYNTFSPLPDIKRKNSNEIEYLSDVKKRRVSNHEKVETVENTGVSKGEDCQDKGHGSTKVLLSDHDGHLSESIVIKEFRRLFACNTPNDIVLPEPGKVIKKEKGGGAGNIQYSRMHCEMNQRKVVISMLNSTPEAKLRKLGYSMETHPYPQRTSKLKHNENCYFIAKTNGSTIKFGLIEPLDGYEDQQRLVVIKKMKLDFPETLNSVGLKFFCTCLKKEVYFQMKASAAHLAPSVLGIAIAEVEDRSLKFYMAMELVAGSLLSCSLHDPVKRAAVLGLSQRINIARQLTVKVKQIHEQFIVHGDMKCGNVMIKHLVDDSGCDKWEVYIIDYGQSEDMRKPVAIFYSPQSINNYLAPEVYCRAIKLWLKYHRIDVLGGARLISPEKADVYSLGVILSQLLADKPEQMQFMKYDHLKVGENSFFKSFDFMWNEIIRKLKIPDPELILLVRKMTCKDPRERPALTEVIEKLDQVLTRLVSTPTNP